MQEMTSTLAKAKKSVLCTLASLCNIRIFSLSGFGFDVFGEKTPSSIFVDFFDLSFIAHHVHCNLTVSCGAHLITLSSLAYLALSSGLIFTLVSLAVGSWTHLALYSGLCSGSIEKI